MQGYNFYLEFLDFFYHILHIAFILWNLLALWFKRFRIWHFITMNLTLFSWFILGIWYGWGYCFLTDLHWELKMKKGEIDLPASYIEYMLLKMGFKLPSEWIDIGVLFIMFILYFFSFYFFIKYRFFPRRQIKDF